MTRELIAGVVSSLLAVLFVESYLRLRRGLSKRSLRLALGRPSSVAVVASVFPAKVESSSVPLMGTHDAYAMAHILTAYRAVGVQPSLVSASVLPDGLDDDLVCIGGPIVNSLTRAHMDLFCAPFRRVDAEDDGVLKPPVYRCGEHEFVDTRDRAWGFIVKLTPQLTGRVHTTLLVWGSGAVGTSGASYFLAELHRALPRSRRESFFVAVPVQRAVGYKGVSTAIVDLSADVWPGGGLAPPAGQVEPVTERAGHHDPYV
ncbi:hypothetical protein ACPFP2_25250 [Micromonospora citrea]|uniref:hypothetical protein n=1 Tax=Micromonospora citrea TaxID=47855 RepID=UPI003C629440